MGWFWWGFALRLHAMGARFTGFLRFSRQFEVKGERNTEHVAHRAQDAAEAGVASLCARGLCALALPAGDLAMPMLWIASLRSQ
ncbi:MAG: hypothetical protein B7Z67_08745 [Acidiphilium sp. 21-60-14]|nr:MAG: hypothetical protein B7Z67_08745 [Acidiphilium sp. 21-60-14]